VDNPPLDWGDELTTAEVVSDLDATSAASNRVQRELLRAIVRCDVRRVWIDDDCRDIAHWVALRLGITTYKARRWVACAWALDRYPSFDAAFVDGRLSLDKLVELTRLADAVDDSERSLLSWALRVSIAAIRDRADWARRVALEEVQEAERARSVKWWWEMDRSYMNLHACLPADMGIRITTALDRVAATLPVSPVDEHDDHDEVSLGTLGDDVVHGDDGMVVGIGKTSRVIPAWLRRQVEQRDGFRCTFPNCGSRRGTDAHHVVPWPHGPTDVDNLTLVCRTHHRLVHDHGWHVMLAADQSARWFRPDWTPYVPRPPAEPERAREPGGLPLDGFLDDEKGLRPAGSARTSGARCRRPSILSTSRPSPRG
jgi:Domain of unknown function (DUF222)